MVHSKLQKCPLFRDQVCPRGEKASHACRIRMNGDFDPVVYFKDLLVMHCAIYNSQLHKENRERVR
jgi:hypothetical protein